ncbi:protein claret segregational [Anastrepha obliqua]|uniref:protein claret segregational n=1 Tax=Anastrepha obliqua TaxID=95512 RepID=UPI002409D895|nr:protein claret segregational [Anastrepha obliqua]
MNSKLPKPSGLKRPTALTRNILPMDRIKPATLGFGSKSANLSISGMDIFHPLTRDLTNLPNGSQRRERARSPDISRPNTANITGASRNRLRRSRSACDIRDMRPMKRPELTLAPIPAKTTRLANTGASNNTALPTQMFAFSSNSAASKPPRIGNCTASSAVTNRKQLTTRPLAGANVGSSTSGRTAITNTTTTTVATKLSTTKKCTAPGTATSVSTTGAGKPINKRIPPYDFKARYNDLLERYKVLKAKYEEKCEQMGSMEGVPEQLEESQEQLFKTKEELKNLYTERDCLSQQIKSLNLKIDSISGSLVKTKEELEFIFNEHQILKEAHTTITNEVIELRERSISLAAENKILQEDLTSCKEQLFHANLERKELHNTIMDLRGNIRVFCRVRPPLDFEREKLLCGWNYIDESTVEIQSYDNKNKCAAHTFSFDHVFHPNSKQEDIFEMVSPLIQSALDGYNICIFAYGQTGSGKTYTMDGIPTNVGVIPRTVDLLFDSIKNYKRLGWDYEIRVTFLEIYNEVLYDLLSNDQKDMEIRMAKHNKNDIYVSNITQETVVTATRLRELMQVAKMNRATACTVGNERSSRSHAVTKIELIGYHAEKNETSVGTINLVDLAGSESPKTSIRMNETKNINRSLSELTNVILALLQKQDHIPYRNSKLTHLLMPSLGGNSKTLMFINVAPFLDCFVESVKSLRFAASVNSCKMAKAKRNRYLNTSSNNLL